MSDEIHVRPYDEQYARCFAELNYQWIAESYSIEAHDREQLEDPESIIKGGGQIFFAVLDNECVGTVAMIMHGVSELELAKMAVSPRFWGRGISNLLMDACIAFARSTMSERIILESNTKQSAAISLYRKFGFVETPLDPNSQFARANIRMQLDLTSHLTA